ncbi:TetR/AcrR family transcriptional regulator [Roseateles depolymerans]|uniref:TetR/AcrR family transcriptional regulator n=1 Tax=Roseateles depolymerans TaxID=76731 RepID=UPI001E4B9FEC|nr:TetR/AcrR family transcriptional regulator [Roseateles depolymerans]
MTRQLLVRGGYNSFSYANVAEQVNITKASIHHHFPSKEELVKTVVAHYRQDAAQALAGLTGQLNDPIAELRAYVDYWASCIARGESEFCVCVMLATEMPSIPSDVAQEVRAHFDSMTTWLADVIERGVARQQFQLDEAGNATRAAHTVLAAVHGAMLLARVSADPSAFSSVAHAALHRLQRSH